VDDVDGGGSRECLAAVVGQPVSGCSSAARRVTMGAASREYTSETRR
jgi:hypothetical protein